MLKDKIVLVTGVGGGIGNTIVKHLVPLSKHVISSSRSDISVLFDEQLIPSNYIHFPLDLTHESNVMNLFQQIKQEYGRLDVFINTIGASLYAHPIEEFPVEEFEQIINLNLTSAFLLTKHCIKLMKNNTPKEGNIVHFISSSARKISTNKGPYGIAKAGLAKLVNYTASEVGKYDIRINGISPGYVFTPRHIQDMQKKMEKTGKSEEEVAKSKMKLQQIDRRLYSEDLLPLVELLSTTKIITGQNYNATIGEVLNY